MAMCSGQPYPIRQIDLPLLRNEFQDAGVRHGILVPIYQLEEHRVCNVQPCQLVEGAGWHHDLSAMVDILSLGTRQHGNGVAAIVFVEAARLHAACSAHHAWGEYAGHGVVVLIEAWVELMVKVSDVVFESSKVEASTILRVVRLTREERDSECVDPEEMWSARAGEVMFGKTF